MMGTTSLFAQTVIDKPGGSYGWKYPVDPAGHTWDVIVDRGIQGAEKTIADASGACTAPVAPETRWTCRTPIPLLAPGPHTLEVVAKVTVDGVTYKSQPGALLKVTSQIVEAPTDGFLELPTTAKPAVKKPGGQ